MQTLQMIVFSMKRHFFQSISAMLCAILCMSVLAAPICANAKEPVVVVLDPGHGGESEGAAYNGIYEKDIDLSVALMTGSYLSQFEGITVYLTRSDDVEVTLEDRAKLAHDVNADFFYSIHFNASDSHALYGSEVWVSAFGEYYTKGYQFAKVLLSNMSSQLGIYSRGCKTRLNSKGTDYYGVIRMCTSYGIPSCIIEHCHIDNNYDYDNYISPEILQQMAYQDAISIAMYFGLSSETLGLDFSDYERVPCETPVRHDPDTTPPDYAIVAPVSADASAKTATVVINALDSNSSIKYFSYSLNQGRTWSALIMYGGGPAIVTLPLQSANDTITIAAYNQYDRYTISNTIDPIP
ncbi:MAG: N-acetylmuramoyl-L-alanine amidase [Lachnospiraceae bacterium]|nr:N-acetylmuramoyl-L-alanine amidase [Lachnospiraceae bacterium]